MEIKYYSVVGYRVFLGNYDCFKSSDNQETEGKIYCCKCFSKFNHISWEDKFIYDSIHADSRLAHSGLKCSECGDIIPEYKEV